MLAMSGTDEQQPSSRFSSDEERWAAVVRRDQSAVGVFYYSVRTTGVYCRPGCAARLPRRENVRFHASREAAEQAGCRPCKRCRPDAPALAEKHVTAVTRACRLLEVAEETPSLEALAEPAGMSRFYFHRVFKEVVGVTPRAYAREHRMQRVRDELSRSNSVTEAIYNSGFNSSGNFYAQSSETLGMTPAEFRAGGQSVFIRFAVGECSLGAVLVAVTKKGICAISLGDDPNELVHDLEDRFTKARLMGGERGFERWVASVIGFIEQPALGLDLPLDVRGTAFQQRVWQALREIPLGTTESYTQVAARIDAPKAVRAVAGACASNQIAVAIPCHRVVRRDGALSGYRWGVERKRKLLAREATL